MLGLISVAADVTSLETYWRENWGGLLIKSADTEYLPENLDCNGHILTFHSGIVDAQATARFQNGCKYYSEEMLTDAIVELGKAIEITPGFAQAYYIRALIMHELGQDFDALADLGQAIDFDTEDNSPKYIAQLKQTFRQPIDGLLMDRILDQIDKLEQKPRYRLQTEVFLNVLFGRLIDFQNVQRNIAEDRLRGILYNDQIGYGISLLIDEIWSDWETKALQDGQRVMVYEPQPDSTPSPTRRLIIRMIQGRQEPLGSKEQETIINLFGELQASEQPIDLSFRIEEVINHVDSIVWRSGNLSSEVRYPIGCYNLIRNPDFVDSEYWFDSGSVIWPDYQHSGDANFGRYVTLGTTNHTADNIQGDSFILQFIEIPLGVTTAAITWQSLHQTSEIVSDAPVPSDDRQELILLDPDFKTLAIVYRTRENVPLWQTNTVDLTRYIGKKLYVYFNVYNDGQGGRTSMSIDNVNLTACYPK